MSLRWPPAEQDIQEPTVPSRAAALCSALAGVLVLTAIVVGPALLAHAPHRLLVLAGLAGAGVLAGVLLTALVQGRPEVEG